MCNFWRILFLKNFVGSVKLQIWQNGEQIFGTAEQILLCKDQVVQDGSSSHGIIRKCLIYNIQLNSLILIYISQWINDSFYGLSVINVCDGKNVNSQIDHRLSSWNFEMKDSFSAECIVNLADF